LALLAEYDALPKIGHGCGHNLILAMSLGAAAALVQARPELAAGRLAVVGTPAEEGGGGKIRLAEAGVFQGFDAALMVHPSPANLPGMDLLGRIKFRLEFFGQSAHAAAEPELGRNALDGLIGTYNAVSALRQHLPDRTRIHGIITHGGESPNIVPDYAAGLFYVRTTSLAQLQEVFDRVQACAQGAAQAAGVTVKATVDGPSYQPMKRNRALEALCRRKMEALGLAVAAERPAAWSTDAGNLSWVLPVLHAYLAFTDPPLPAHTLDFAQATVGPAGRACLLTGAKLLALVAAEYLAAAELQAEIAAEFAAGD
jgi:amidohydrolase